MVLDETGGLHGVRDRGALLAIEALPEQSVFGTELYPSIYEKAAVYARSLIKNHPFLDGNKRTGMSSAIIFLEDNDKHCLAKKGEIELFAIEIAKGKMEAKEIAEWFAQHFVDAQKRDG